MRRALLLLWIVSLAAGGAAATLAAETPDGAPLEFAIAKLLLAEGSVREAYDTFQRAVAQEPDDAYLRIEVADFLLRLARAQGDPGLRQRQLEEAAVHVDRARELRPESVDVLRAVGQVYMALGDRDPEALPVAVGALEGVRAREPWDLQSMVALGQVYLARGESARGAEILDEASRYVPNNRMLFGLLADAHERAGQSREAEEALGKLLDLDPFDVESRVRLVELQGRRNDHRAALATLEGAPEAARDDGRLRFLKARELFLAGRVEEALDEVDGLKAARPGGRLDLYVTELRSRILSELGRDREAAAEARSLLEMDPTNPALVRQVVGMLVDLGETGEAVAMLEAFLDHHGESEDSELAPALQAARLSLASLYTDDEAWDNALAVLAPLMQSEEPRERLIGVLDSAEILYRADRTRKALELLEEKDDGEAVLTGKRAELLLRSDEDQKAMRLLRAQIRVKDPQPGLEVVRSFHRLQRYEETLPVLAALTKKHSDSAEAYFLLGTAAERTGAPERAASAFLRLLELDPDNAPALNYLGYMWADLGENLDRALGLVQRAVELDPHNGAYADSLGWAYYRLGNLGEARTHLERAVLLVPGDPVVYEHLGDVYSALGEPGKAAEFYRRALQAAGDGAPDVDPEQVRKKLRVLAAD